MFIPKYLITNSLLHDISSIDAARELILRADLIPAWQTKLKEQAFFDSLFYGSKLEGVPLTEEEIHHLIAGGDSTDLSWQLNKNLAEALTEVNQLVLKNDQPGFLTVETILELHRIITKLILPPEDSGQLRRIEAVVKNAQTGEVSLTPPPSAEVSYLIEDLVDWLNSDSGRNLHPIFQAAIAHFEIYRIQPFVFGNEAIARLVSHLVLRMTSYDLQKRLSLEEYLANTQIEYYLTLQSVAGQKVLDVQDRDLTLWLEYFTRAVMVSVQRLKEVVLKVAVTGHPRDRLGEEVTLNERQMAIIEYLNKHGEMRNKDFRKIFPDFSDDTVLRELKFLKQKGLVLKQGNTKRAIYVLGSSD